MSDSLEKFVLQYSVDMQNSIDRLEQLSQKIEQVNKKGSSSGSKTLSVFKDLGSELKPLSAGFGAIESIITKLGYRIAWLGPIIAGIAFAVKSVTAVRKEFEQQRSLSFTSGLSIFQIEQFQRQANQSSGGIIGAEGSRGIVKKISDLIMNSFTNPDIVNKDALVLQKLGTKAIDNGKIKDTQKALDEITERLRSVSKNTAIAVGALAGLSADEVAALRNRTDKIKESSKITEDETRKLIAQQQALETIRNSTGRIQEAWRRIELVMAEAIMPDIATMIENSATFIENIRDVWDEIVDGFYNFADKVLLGLLTPLTTPEERDEILVDRMLTRIVNNSNMNNENYLRGQNQNLQESRSAQALFTRDINLFSSAVSMFAGVIDERQAWAAWAGEIGAASLLGDRLGIATIPTGAKTSEPFPNAQIHPKNLDAIYEEAAKKFASSGVTPELLKAITKVESNFNANAVSHAGASGLMQVMPANFKSVGITDPFDPRQNIFGGAQILSNFLKAAKGDLDLGLKMYAGGFDRSNWGKVTRAYPDKVKKALNYFENNKQATIDASYSAPKNDAIEKYNNQVTEAIKNKEAVGVGEFRIPPPFVSGERNQVKVVNPYENSNSNVPKGAQPFPALSGMEAYAKYSAKAGETLPVKGITRGDVQLKSVQESIAQYLGIPLNQLRLGDVSKGDVDFALRYIKIGTQRDYIKNTGLAQLSEGQGRQNVTAQAYQSARLASIQLEALNRHGSEILAKAKAGERNITLGQKEINININGVEDPLSNALQVQDLLRKDDINDINNAAASAIKW